MFVFLTPKLARCKWDVSCYWTIALIQSIFEIVALKVSKKFSWFDLFITSLLSLPTNQHNHDSVALLILVYAVLIFVFSLFRISSEYLVSWCWSNKMRNCEMILISSRFQNLHFVFLPRFKCRAFLYLRFIWHLRYSPLSSYPTRTRIPFWKN